MKRETLLRLVGKMCLLDNNPKVANRAFTEFHHRFGDKVYGLCRYYCLLSPLTRDEEIANDIAQEVFIKFYLNISKFRLTQYADSEKLESGILSLLKIISWQKYLECIDQMQERNGFSKFLYDRHIENVRKSIDDSGCENDGIIEQNYLHLRNQLTKKTLIVDKGRITEVMQRLPKREFDILLTYLHYYPSRVPSVNVRKLSKKYGVKIDSIRVFKRRALIFLEKELLDIVKEN